MALYPSFSDVESHEIKQVHNLVSAANPSAPPEPELTSASIHNGRLYPMVEYMGLDLSKYSPTKNNPAAIKQAQEIQVSYPSFVKGQVTGGIRQLVLCKDENGKIGLLLSEVDKGIFVSFVQKNSPAAMAGLRFGDQILQVNDTILAGYSADKVHKLLKKCDVNGINFIIRDRPFERTVTLVKDAAGYLGFKYENGKITSVAKDSSAARNGLLTDHNILEIQGQNIVGLSDKNVSKLFQNVGQIVNITIIPSFIYDQMLRKIHPDFMKASMDHSIAF